MGLQKISSNIVDVINKKIFSGTVFYEDGIITKIEPNNETYDNFILPGLVDAHVHIESSMLVPTEFARIAVTHGTVATVSDPHEIANVLGINGVKYMIENAEKTPFKFYFSAPSCVPATDFETAGAELGLDEVDELLQMDSIKYLGEMMNFPGVVYENELVMGKIQLAQKYGKPVDGHAPGLVGEQMKQYFSAGITTDHECFTYQEGLETVEMGVFVQIREGSAAKNFEELIPLANEYSNKCMLCSDDKHPDDLQISHINALVKRALEKGIDFFKVMEMCTINPVIHYDLEVGLLQKNDPADFIVIDSIEKFNVLQTYIDGELVSENGKTNLEYHSADAPNNFNTKEKSIEDFKVTAQKNKQIRVIEMFDGLLSTKEIITEPKIENGEVVSDTERDILKIAVVNRYENVPPMTGFIKNFGLQKGAIASCVAHDSHNIVVVGVDDESITKAVNLIIQSKGGVSAVNASKNIKKVLELPVAGIMSNESYEIVAAKYSEIDKVAKSFGSNLHAPFMSLSFMALLVIPELKIGDKGVFDGKNFEIVDLFVENSEN